MNIWTSQNWVGGLGWTLVHFLWQGTAIALVTAAILRLMRGAAANARYAVCCTALSLMLLVPAMTFYHYASKNSTSSNIAPDSILESGIVLQPPAESQRDILSSPVKRTLDLAAKIEALFPWLVLAWLLGVFALSCRLLGGWLQLRRLKKSAIAMVEESLHDELTQLTQRLRISRTVRLMQSALVEVPGVIGWLRPMILLPAGCMVGLSPAQLEAILAHELAHIRRHDYLVNLLQSIIETLLFYHPGVWWVSRKIREERENCCDDVAVAVCGDSSVYARALATLEELRVQPVSLAMAADSSPLLPRIRRLAGQSARNKNGVLWSTAGIALLVITTMLTLGLFASRARARAQEALARSQNATTHADDQQSQPFGTAGAQPSQDDATGTRSVSAGTNPYTGNSTTAGNASTGGANDTMKSNYAHTGKGRKAIMSKLDDIEIDSLRYDALPLNEVIQNFSEIAKVKDPEHEGINFFIDRASTANGGAIDPTTGLPQEFDINSTTITINPPLRHLSLRDALDAVTRGADHPVHFTVLDYAVVFSMGKADEAQLQTQIFRVDPNTFRQGLEGVSGVPSGTTTSSASFNGGSGVGGGSASVPQANVIGSETSANLQPLVRQFLSSAGVDMDTNNSLNAGKTFVWNNRKGVLVVRATSNELANVEAALDAFSKPAAQFVIQTKFVETDQPLDNDFLLRLTERNKNPRSGMVTGIVADKDFQAMIEALEKKNGTDILTTPNFVTESGRQARISPSDAGPTLDVTPRVGSDNSKVTLDLIVNTQSWTTNAPSGSSGERKLRQFSSFATLHDGQTVVITGLPIASAQQGANHTLLIFVTPMMINPDGSRANHAVK